MDEQAARRVLHRFKYGESVQQYRGEFGFIFIPFYEQKAEYVLSLCVT